MQRASGSTLGLGQPRWHRPGQALVALGLVACLLLGWGPDAAAQPKPAGEMRWALSVTFPPAWLDPAEVAVGGQTLFWILYALHDALVKRLCRTFCSGGSEGAVAPC